MSLFLLHLQSVLLLQLHLTIDYKYSYSLTLLALTSLHTLISRRLCGKGTTHPRVPPEELLSFIINMRSDFINSPFVWALHCQ